MRDEGVTRVQGEVLFPRTLMRDEVFDRMQGGLFPRTLMRDEGVTRVQGEVLFPRTLMRDEVFDRMQGEVLGNRTLMRDEVFDRMVRKGGSILCGCYWLLNGPTILKLLP
jgi:hypothetical protein